ncbi:MAG TPA: class I SAM-dependent methyltransferase [Chlamydiales bacterium]|nr:class I SAM-dependent methyltransferase [Chlamydiales bacterium]
MKILLPLLFLVSLYAECELETIANKYVNTKGDHDYLSIYDQYFSSKRNNKLTLLEIGFGAGGSASMWEEYFPEASLHYIDNIDIDIHKVAHLSTRSHFHLGHQADESFLDSVVTQVEEFDIIIDDASHQMDDQIATLKYLFPYVKSGGVYVIEDLHTSYWQAFGGRGKPGSPRSSPNSTTEFLKKLVDKVNYVGAYIGCANRDMAKIRVDLGVDQFGTYTFPKSFFEDLTIWERDIKSIHFYDSICFIFKR